MPATLPFLPKRWRENLLKDIGGVTEIDLNDPVARMIAAGSEHFQRQLPPPAKITPEQMQGWKMPVYVAMAAQSSLHNAGRAIKVAQANVEQLQAQSWPNATHSLPMEINAEVLAFMDRV
jgi:hypothetical protein